MSPPRLAEEIMQEILEMLPVKTLWRFRVAFKSWYTRITSLQFKEVHHDRRTVNPPLLLKVRNPNKEDHNPVPNHLILQLSTYNTVEETVVENFDKEVKYPFKCYKPNFIQSCRGLVCIASTVSDSIIICNPSTQELEYLPPWKGYTNCIGFGYAALTKEFKVVRLFRHNYRFCCNVLTVGSSQWRAVSVDPYHTDRHSWGLELAPFLNGALHFLPLNRNSNQENDCISVFDVEKEVYSRMSLPDQDLKEFSERRLSELQGSLCLTVASEFGQDTSPVELWILKNYDNAEWVKEYEISAFPGKGWIVPIGFMRDEIIFMNASWTAGNELIYYCPQSKTISSKRDKDYSAVIFVESLFTPEGA